MVILYGNKFTFSTSYGLISTVFLHSDCSGQTKHVSILKSANVGEAVTKCKAQSAETRLGDKCNWV